MAMFFLDPKVEFWVDKLHYDATLWADLERGSDKETETTLAFLELLCVLTAQDPALCEYIAEQGSPWLGAILSRIGSDDDCITQQSMRLATNVVVSAKQPAVDNRFPSELPFESFVSLFRTGLTHQTTALQTACRAFDRGSLQLRAILGQSPEWPTKPGNPKDDDLTPEELESLPAFKDSIMVDYDRTLFMPPPTPFEIPEEDGSYTDRIETVALMPDSPLRARRRPQTGPHDEEEQEQDQQPKSPRRLRNVVSEAAEAARDIWTISTDYVSCQRAYNLALTALEFVAEICEGRLELQSVLLDSYPGLFLHFSAFLCRLDDTDRASGRALKQYFPGRLNVCGFHPTLAHAAATAIRTLVRRYPQVRSLVCQSGCVEAIMKSLTESIGIGDDRLAQNIILTFEQLVLRSEEVWLYVQRIGGLDGLLRLLDVGNSAMRQLACAAIGNDAKVSGTEGSFFRENCVRKGIMKLLQKCMSAPEAAVHMSTLALLRYMLSSELARVEAMDQNFLISLTGLLSGKISVSCLPHVEFSCCWAQRVKYTCATRWSPSPRLTHTQAKKGELPVVKAPLKFPQGSSLQGYWL